jgi:poly-beta-1,6-N-acetyl-D-glucosamine synthase
MGEIMLITGILLLLTACLYAGLIGLFTFGWYRRNADVIKATVKTDTKISVIVAARNEDKYITDLMIDLAAQDYPASLLEVLVVDDHSEDNTVDIVRNIIVERKLDGFKLINLATIASTDGFTRQLNNHRGDPGGKKSAIAAGISKATGDVILLTDADCRVGPAWVSAMEAYFQDEKKMMVFGPVSYFPVKGILNRFQSLEFSGLVASGAGAAEAGRPFMCNGANLAYRKEAYINVNGYKGNEKFISGDDVFLLHKMKKKFGGSCIAFCKDEKALVKTYPVKGLRRFISQRIRWASKSQGYKDILSIMTAIIIFSYSLIVLISFIVGLCNPCIIPLFISLFILKILADLPLMLGITRFTGEKSLMRWYVPFQVIYPLYVVIAGLGSFFGRKKW